MLDKKKPFRKNKPLILLLCLFVSVTALMSGILIDLCLEAANEESNAVISYAKADEQQKENAAGKVSASDQQSSASSSDGWDFGDSDSDASDGWDFGNGASKGADDGASDDWSFLTGASKDEDGKELLKQPAKTEPADADGTSKEETDEADRTSEEPSAKDSSDTFDPVVPKSEKVKNDYFKDALFVGNSRTMGLQLSAGVEGAEYITDIGMNVGAFFDREISYQGQMMTMADAVSLGEYKKVYLMFGINEVGWYDTGAFIRCYGKIIRHIRKVQPEAVIYVQSVIHCTKEKAQEDKIFGKKRINEYNELLKKLAARKKVYFVNVDEAVVNEKGILPDEASSDGIHLNYAYCKKWMNYLKTHTVREDTQVSEYQKAVGKSRQKLPEDSGADAANG